MALTVTVDQPGSSLLDAALTYAGFGWHVFPVRLDKKPFTRHGFKDAASDPGIVRRLWLDYPHAGIGIACGASKLVVIDYDPADDTEDAEGKQFLSTLIAATNTRTCLTGRGGWHYYFRAHPDFDIRNSASKIAPGVDVRGNGGYTVAPPSRNEHGPYVWLNGSGIAPLPDETAKILFDKQAMTPTAIADETDGRVTKGARNDRLASLAGTLRRRNFAPLAIVEALLIENQEHFDPPLERDEVVKLARGVVERYDPIEPLTPGEPRVQLIGDDSVKVDLVLGDGRAASFLFTEMEKSQRELACHVEVSVEHDKEPVQQRINLESFSAQEAIRRQLDGLYGKDASWVRAVNSAWIRARSAFLTQDRSLGMAEIPLLTKTRLLIDPIMPTEGTTILFGDGSANKSYISTALAIAGVTGSTFAGKFAVPQSRVLYVDYEDSETTFKFRQHRLLAGLGLPDDAADDGLRYWKARGLPIKDQIDAIKRAIDRHHIDWMVIDSAGFACGRPPEESEAALSYLGALSRIGLPTITIAHIVKKDEKGSRDKPFGSVFWSNGARRTWYVHRVQEEESDVSNIALYCRKVNNGRKPNPLSFDIEFDGDTGPVTFKTASMTDSPELLKQTSAQNRIWALLDRPRSTSELAELTEMSEATVRKTLTRHRDKFIEVGGLPTPGQRATKLWSRLARGQSLVRGHASMRDLPPYVDDDGPELDLPPEVEF